MKINLDANVVLYNGEPLVTSDKDPSPMTVGDTLSMACVNANPEIHKDGAAKYHIYRLLKKVSREGEVSLKNKEVTLLKQLVGEAYAVAVMGPLYDILDPEEEETPPDD